MVKEEADEAVTRVCYERIDTLDESLTIVNEVGFGAFGHCWYFKKQVRTQVIQPLELHGREGEVDENFIGRYGLYV